MMRRREFITLLAGAAAWPLVARAQQVPVVGFLNGASPAELSARVAAFRDGLTERGYVEGNTVAVEYRWGFGQYDRLPEIAVDLVRRGVAVIAATGGVPSVRAAKAATSTIPIVFTMGGDPVALGVVQSGALMGYALDLSELFRRMADDVHKILKGAKPGDIPIYQATKFELLINLKTAKAFSLTLPPALIGRADEVIE